jgi:hypothetical protein
MLAHRVSRACPVDSSEMVAEEGPSYLSYLLRRRSHLRPNRLVNSDVEQAFDM